jgi:hypothetical protein
MVLEVGHQRRLVTETQDQVEEQELEALMVSIIMVWLAVLVRTCLPTLERLMVSPVGLQEVAVVHVKTTKEMEELAAREVVAME